MDNIIYKLEDIHGDIEQAIFEDREYFLDRKDEALIILDQLKELLEDG